MSLIILNGSPRGKRSNSTVIASWFSKPYWESEISMRFLGRVDKHGEILSKLNGDDEFLLVFPLYADGMPGQVKHFLELMEQQKERLRGCKVSFIIHSGFGETIHCRALEEYLIHFAKKAGLNNHGVIIIPMSEGIRLMSPSMTKKRRDALGRLANNYKNRQPYNNADLSYLNRKETLSVRGRFLYRMGEFLGLGKIYWCNQFIANKAYKKRFAAPYANQTVQITTKAYLTNSRT